MKYFQTEQRTSAACEAHYLQVLDTCLLELMTMIITVTFSFNIKAYWKHQTNSDNNYYLMALYYLSHVNKHVCKITFLSLKHRTKITGNFCGKVKCQLFFLLIWYKPQSRSWRDSGQAWRACWHHTSHVQAGQPGQSVAPGSLSHTTLS